MIGGIGLGCGAKVGVIVWGYVAKRGPGIGYFLAGRCVCRYRGSDTACDWWTAAVKWQATAWQLAAYGR